MWSWCINTSPWRAQQTLARHGSDQNGRSNRVPASARGRAWHPPSTKKTHVERLKTSIAAAAEAAAAEAAAAAGASHSSSSSSSMDTRSPAQHRVAGFRPFRIPVPPRHIGPPPLPAPRGGAPPATLAQQSGRGKQPSTRFDKLDKDLETLTVLTVPPF